VTAVKAKAQKRNPKEQHRHHDVIGFRQPGRKTDAAQNDRKERRSAADRRQYRTIAPVVMSERAIIRDQLFSAEG
jgi:hypothetical protein